MIIQHNMQAMNTNRQLGISQSALAKSTEKLSSGYRINRAGDDAAGLAISEKMRSQIRGLDRASDNSQDGISLIQTAEGALNESQSILQRMRELAVQAANDTNTVSDREEIQKEINQLTSEINRIANTTEFNTMKLLRGGSVETSKSVGDGYTVIDFSSQIMSLEDTTAPASLGSSKVTLTETQKSTVAKGESTAVIVGGKADATGSTSGFALKESGRTAKKASIKFDSLGITISQKTASGSTGSVSMTTTMKVNLKLSGSAGAKLTAGGLTIALDKNKLDTIGDQGALAGYIQSLVSGEKFDVSVTTNKSESAIDGVIKQLKNICMSGSDIRKSGSVTRSGIVSTTTFSSGVGAKKGKLVFKIDDAFDEAGDTITILGQTFTTAFLDSNSDTNGSNFNISSGNTVGSSTHQMSGLVDAIKASSLGDKISGRVSGGSIVLEEKSGHEGTLVVHDTSKDDISIEGNGSKDSLTITNPDGTNNLKYKLVKATSSGSSVSEWFKPEDKGRAATKSDPVQVGIDKNTGIVYIALSEKAEENTAAKIEAALQAMGKQEDITVDGNSGVTVDFSNVKAEAGGDWDSSMTNKLDFTNTVDGNTAHGKPAKQGEYTLKLSEALTEGETINIGGQTFTAKKGGNAADGEIDISSDKPNDQLTKLLDAIENNAELSEKYKVEIKNNSIVLKEKEASGKALTADSSTTPGGDTPGTTPGGDTPGTTPGGDTPSTGGTFKVKLQVGANTGQSMTVTIDDNRALALGISKNSANGSTAVEADGRSYTAKFAATANVTDGTTEENIEYALDISSHDSATAAISVIDDALAKISDQRAQLGAYQNRLEHTIANLDNTSENLQAAESRIRDVDMAEEMTKYSKNNILLQAAQSMLAQANQSTQGVLTLLR